MAPGVPRIDEMRRLWSEGLDVSEIARVTGHDRKTASVRQKHTIDGHRKACTVGTRI